MLKKYDFLKIFLSVFILVVPAACSSISPNPTPTPTPGGSIQSGPADGNPLPNQGILSIEFRDVLVQEVCAFDLPFSLDWEEGQGLITGETEASCLLSAVQCGDACITMNSDWELEVSLSGTVYVHEKDSPEGEIHADLVFSGLLKNYASEWPAGAVPAFTIEQPFIVEQPGLILPIVLALQEGASTSISPEGGGEPLTFTLCSLSQ